MAPRPTGPHPHRRAIALSGLAALSASGGIFAAAAASSAPEPFPFLHGANATAGPPAPLSPDPLVRYRWDPSVNRSEPQLYTASPVGWDAYPPSSFAVDARPGDFRVAVTGPGYVRLDLGVERASWLEFESDDLGPLSLKYLTCSVSEDNSPWESKARRPVGYGPSSFRLETNGELYEGVRYAWIAFEPPPDAEPAAAAPFHLYRVRVVARVMPVNYAGSYRTSDVALESAWYTGAYGARLNMNPDAFGTVLMERGDRVPIQGDNHPTMAAALAAFGTEAYDIIRKTLRLTDSGCPGCRVVDDNIMSYPVYWTMSVNDYYWASGDRRTFDGYIPDIMSILDEAAETFWPDRPELVWMGWDDRLGDGWCGECNEEAQLTFASLLVRAHADFGRALAAAGHPRLSRRYMDTALRLGEALTGAGQGWSKHYGLHAAANAINAGLTVPAEAEELFEREFDDVVRVCSMSNFNQYWILQAMGNAGRMDHALSSVRLCWGGMLRLSRGCFWEEYSPEWDRVLGPSDRAPGRPSYCHPWSSGVTAWLTEAHAGIRPLEPGYRSYLAAPYVSSRTPYVSATVGTPLGPIGVSANLTAETGEVAVEVDARVPGRAALRRERDGCALLGFRKGGASGGALAPALTADAIREGGETPARLGPLSAASLGFSDVLPPGRHRIVGVYGACDARVSGGASEASDAPFAPFPPAFYPAAASADGTTRGDWVGAYGHHGYVLFAFNNGTDLQRLPSYVRNVSGGRRRDGRRVGWSRAFRGTSSTDATFLLPPPGTNRSLRGLGSIGDDCAVSCSGNYIDVDVTDDIPGGRYRLSLYMAAADPGDSLAVRAMDLGTMSPVAPLPLVRDYGGGVYWRLEYHGGVRLRVVPVYGGAAVSALFFDPVGA